LDKYSRIICANEEASIALVKLTNPKVSKR